MRDRRVFTPAEVADALRANNGLVGPSARALHCDQQTVRNHIKRSALVRTALQESREMVLDVAEASLYNQVLAGEGWAVCFILKCLGKDRGYVERAQVELSGSGGGPLLLQWAEAQTDDA